jgi:hypothetical protein
MFYTIATKIPIISSNESKNKFLKIYLLGSVLYLLLHYYLYSVNTIEALDKLKYYLYYIMIVDLGLAYYLSGSVKMENEEFEDNEEIEDKVNSKNEQDIQEHKMEQLKLQQIQQHQIQQQLQQHVLNIQKNMDNSNSSATSPFITKDNIEKNEKKKITTTSSSSKKESKTEKVIQPTKKSKKIKNITEEKIDTDTNIPLFSGA